MTNRTEWWLKYLKGNERPRRRTFKVGSVNLPERLTLLRYWVIAAITIIAAVLGITPDHVPRHLIYDVPECLMQDWDLDETDDDGADERESDVEQTSNRNQEINNDCV